MRLYDEDGIDGPFNRAMSRAMKEDATAMKQSPSIPLAGCHHRPGVFFFAIPGEPVPQGRGKVGRWKAKDGREGVAVRDPTKSRNWKAYAVGIYRAELESAGLQAPLADPDEPVRVVIAAFFACPKSQHRKREPVPRRPHVGRGDCDNIAKAALDAGNGVLWIDDAQVFAVAVTKLVAAQGEAPRVEVSVTLPRRRGEVQP